jgi:peptidoglycan/LPS O-acetylase OafA/YrhL
MVVLLHHSLLLDPTFPASPQDGSVEPGSAIWWLSYTPLKLLSAGWESVIVFFVLSGLVVTLPAVRRPGFDWIAFYPRRIVRLLVPVMASVLVAAAFVFAIPQIPTQSGGWLNTSSTPAPSWEMVVQAWDLVGGDGQINNPLWSLRWELLFSLALPVFVLLALVLRRWWVAGLAGAVLLTWLGVRTGSGALSYFPAFFVGALMATRLEDIRQFSSRINRLSSRHLVWFGMTLAAALLLIVTWLMQPVSAGLGELTPALKALAPLAAAGLVLSCIGWRPLGSLLSERPFQFVGRISFSVYLVHVPILIFSGYLFRGQPVFVPMLFGIGLTLLVAVCFSWLVEQRSHGWARSAGQWASARYAAMLGERHEQPMGGQPRSYDAARGRREAATPARPSRAS